MGLALHLYTKKLIKNHKDEINWEKVKELLDKISQAMEGYRNLEITVALHIAFTTLQKDFFGKEEIVIPRRKYKNVEIRKGDKTIIKFDTSKVKLEDILKIRKEIKNLQDREGLEVYCDGIKSKYLSLLLQGDTNSGELFKVLSYMLVDKIRQTQSLYEKFSNLIENEFMEEILYYYSIKRNYYELLWLLILLEESVCELLINEMNENEINLLKHLLKKE